MNRSHKIICHVFGDDDAYRNGQGSNGTRLRLVPSQPWPLRYSFEYSDNDVLLDNT